MIAPGSPMARVGAALAHAEPDRVPLFLTTTMHGARELGLPIEEYFSRAEHVVEGQLRMQRRYRSDFYYPLMYAAAEYEAFGGTVLFRDDGPPNAGAPLIQWFDEIRRLEPPDPLNTPVLRRTLEVTSVLAEHAAGAIPVVGVAVSPFSLPVMQLGFEGYLRLLHENRELFWELMRVNEEFTVRWANLQLAAGATAIGYFDPLASPTIVQPELYRATGWKVACRTLRRIDGPTATHLASGRSLGVLDDVAGTGTQIVGVSAEEDLAEIKRQVAGRMVVLGNLNGVAMRRWSAAQAEAAVKHAIARGGPGGGFILADNHGEIPWQVPEEVLDAISAAVERWGRYPLDWVTQGEA